MKGRAGGGGSEINTNKWGWDGQLVLTISKNKFVKRRVKTSTKHNNIFLKYAIKQSFQGKPIINTFYLHTLCYADNY